MNILLLFVVVIVCNVCSGMQLLTTYKGKLYTIIIATVCLILIANNRWYNIPDITGYLNNFSHIDMSRTIYNVGPNVYGFDAGFMVLSHIIKQIWDNECFYLCVIFLINYYCIYRGGSLLYDVQKKDKSVNFFETIGNINRSYFSALFVSLWLGYFGVLYGMAVLRAGLATSIAFLGLILFYKRKYLISVVLLIIAFLMQSFSILLIAVSLLTYRFINIKKQSTYYIWFLICLVLWLSRISLYLMSSINYIAELLSRYIIRFGKFSLFYNEIAGNGFFSKKNMLFLLMAILFIYFKPKEDRQYETLLNIFMVGLTITYLTNEILVGYRLSDMFFIFSVPLEYYLITRKGLLTYHSRLILVLFFVAVPFVISLRIVT